MPQAASWAGTPSIKGSTESIRMALLTFSLIGLQYVAPCPQSHPPTYQDNCRFTWGIEMTCEPFAPLTLSSGQSLTQSTDCTPYLLQLGLTKSRTSLVWIAGPLSGIIMQPVVGVLADNSRSKWGRRRPFMIGGALIVALCLLVLGWTAEIVGIFVVEPDTVGDKCDQTP